jgi:protein SCO1/2
MRRPGSRIALAAAFLVAACGPPATPPAGDAASAILARLAAAGEGMDHATIAADLDRLRALGPAAMPEARSLLALLPESSPIYRGRGPNEATRLRAWVLTTLAAVGPPPAAAAQLRDVLLLEQNPRLLAAAARAAGALGSPAAGLVPSLERILDPAFADDLVSLDAYDALATPGHGTTARFEALAAIARIGSAPPTTREAVAAIAAAPPGRFGSGDRLQAEARRVLAAVGGAADPAPSCCEAPAELATTSPARGAFVPRAERTAPPASVVLTDQDGVATPWPQLFDRPAALCFFYTQCDNPRKCSSTVSKMAVLQRLLATQGLAARVRLVLVTLDPAFDAELVRRRYAELRGFEPSAQAVVASVPEAPLHRLVSELGANANFGQGRVNVHGVELFVIDDRGRVARRHGSDWAARDVATDLHMLLEERRAEPAAPDSGPMAR